MAGPEHDHPSKDEHRQGHKHTNGNAAHFSFNHQDHSGKDRLKRKISSKEYTSTGSSTGVNGSSRQTNHIYSSELPGREESNLIQLQNKNDYRSFLQKPPLNSHNTHQDRYNFNFNQNRETNPTTLTNGAVDTVIGERRRDSYNTDRADINNDKEQDRKQTQTIGHDWSHLYTKQDQLTKKHGESDHPHHHLNTIKDTRMTKDRSTPTDSALAGYRGRDPHRVGSAFSTGWPSIDGRDTESRQDPDLSSVDGKRTGDFLTIRDIIDSKELRDQISEMRRSQNSSIDIQHQQHQPQEQDRGLLSRGRPQTRDSAKSNPATELSMDKSRLEKEFQEKLDAAIPVPDYSKAVPSRQSIVSDQQTPASRVIVPPIDSRADYGSLATGQKREKRYHSSYSPSDFSQDEDEGDEDEEEEEQDTAELQRTVRPGNPTTPKSQPEPVTPSAPAPLSTHQPPLQTLPVGGIKDTQPKAQPQPRKLMDDLDDRDYDNEEKISFEREVAIARAKRKLGASTDNRNAGASMSSGVQPTNGSAPPITTASRLDHGRDLALEDLVSPTKYNFGARQQQQQQQQQQRQQQTGPSIEDKANWRSNPTFPLLSNLEDLNQMNTFAGHEDQFIRLAESLGEGQAVASVLGTLKAMIRELKSDKKTLQKALRKKQKEAERMRKANEKLSKTNDRQASHSAEPRHGKGRAPDSPNPEAREQETRRTGIQHEVDKGEKSMEALQRRIDDLENQRVEIQKRERIRAEEEADLLYLLNSGNDDDEDDDESETESESSSEESNGYRMVSKRQSSARVSSDSSSKAKRERRKLDAHHLSGYERSKSNRRSTRSKSANPETRRVVEKVEEVHIHHHVHYGEGSSDVQPASSSSRSRTINNDRTNRHQSDDGFGINEDMHRLRIGAGFRPRISATEDHLDIPPFSSRNALSRSLPGQRSHLERYSETVMADQRTPKPQPRRHHTEPRTVHGFGTSHQADPILHDEQEERYRPFRVRSSGALNIQGSRSKSNTRGDIRSGGSRVQQLTAALSNPALRQKKISIDLQRILSLLKTHDPTRCTVCCNGGDVGDHDQHHHNRGESHQRFDHQQRQPSPRNDTKPIDVRQSSSSAARTSTKGLRNADSIKVDSETSLSSIPSDDDNGIGSSELQHGGTTSNRSHQRRDDEQSPRTKKELSHSHNSEEKAPTPEQKLHFILERLKEDVRGLRRSYFKLSKDLEAIEGSTDDAYAEGNSNNGNVEGADGDGDPQRASTMGTSGSKLENRSEAFREQQLRQKKMIKKQLREMADSLAEKADLVMQLQEQYAQQRQQQQQQQQQRGRERYEPRDKGKTKEMSGSRHDTRARKREGDNTMSHSDGNNGSSGHRMSRRGSPSDANERSKQGGENGQGREETMEDDISESNGGNEGHDSENYDRDNTQDTARPRRRQGERLSPSREDNNDNDKAEGPARNDQNQRQFERQELKEPEGYRHRLNGQRVPSFTNSANNI
ncbi:hypothetical protein BGZ80_004294 [Entomortierella chlamydospora]|uniref:Uncharacterized protein n=1 Tax=Entomortierella chlamydospora TaxID=101097 RepID=A0A9P6N1P1_9FUNG|nr:hypothetical protein BGZ80_004294 [Entomortierella chlamydospora]